MALLFPRLFALLCFIHYVALVANHSSLVLTLCIRCSFILYHNDGMRSLWTATVTGGCEQEVLSSGCGSNLACAWSIQSWAQEQWLALTVAYAKLIALLCDEIFPDKSFMITRILVAIGIQERLYFLSIDCLFEIFCRWNLLLMNKMFSISWGVGWDTIFPYDLSHLFISSFSE